MKHTLQPCLAKVGFLGLSVAWLSTMQKAADKALSLPGAFVLDLDFAGMELVEKAAPPWAQVRLSTRGSTICAGMDQG